MRYKANEIKTKKSKGLIIFSSIALALSCGFFVLFLLLDENLALKIFILIMLGIFIIVSLFVLLDQLINYTMIKGDVLIDRFFFRTRKVYLQQINKIILDGDFYVVYKDDKKICSLSKFDISTSQMMYQFERFGFQTQNIIKKEPKK